MVANTGSAPLSLTQSPYAMIRRILLAQLQIDYPSVEFCLPRDLSFRPTLENLNSELIVLSLRPGAGPVPGHRRCGHTWGRRWSPKHRTGEGGSSLSYASSFGKRLDHSKSRCHRLFRLPRWQRQDDVVNLRDRLAVTARDLAVAKNRLLAIADEADILRGQLESIETRLRGLKQQLSERETPQPSELAAKVRPVEPVLFEPAPSEANLAHPGVSMPNIFAEAKRRAEGIDEPARPCFGGVNVASLFSQFGVNHAEGGPFVPPPRADQPAGGIVANRPATIRGSAKALTLSTPLEHFQAGSRFGPRRDPFTGGWHTIPGETPTHWPRLGFLRALRGRCERSTAGSREVHGDRASRSDSRKVALMDAPYAAGGLTG
jgi:hypothetical protein